jgi:tRNA-dihydrouridine synthase 1
MVDASELAFRQLCRRYGVGLAYTPMLHAKIFASNEGYRRDSFTTLPTDRPLAAQFCADDPTEFVAAARLLQDRVDAVDLNLGCPQGIARKGHYGAFLQDEWDLIASIVRAGADGLAVPVWCKIRVFACRDKSVAYARMLEDAGCSLLAVHGRTRDQKGKFCLPADLGTIRAIKRAVSIPVIANGNVLCREDAERALEETEAEAVMSAFALLDNPALFMQPAPGSRPPSRLDLAREYLALAEKYNTPMRMVRLHMFKFFRSRLDVNMDLNDKVAACKSIADFQAISSLLAERCDADGISFEERVEAGNTPTHVLCEKTILRMAKAAAAQGAQTAATSEQNVRTLVKPAASGAYVPRKFAAPD